MRLFGKRPDSTALEPAELSAKTAETHETAHSPQNVAPDRSAIAACSNLTEILGLGDPLGKRPAISDPAYAPVVVHRPPPPAPLDDGSGHCARCHHTAYCDVELHEGRSIARECERCGRHLGWLLWQGEPQEPYEWIPGPPPPGEDRWWEYPFDEEDQADPAIRLPSAPAELCRKCGGCFFWGDLFGRPRCASCEKIPMRSAASGESWQVEWTPAGNRWVDWTPEYWQPFAHLEAAEVRAQLGPPDENF